MTADIHTARRISQSMISSAANGAHSSLASFAAAAGADGIEDREQLLRCAIRTAYFAAEAAAGLVGLVARFLGPAAAEAFLANMKTSIAFHEITDDPGATP